MQPATSRVQAKAWQVHDTQGPKRRMKGRVWKRNHPRGGADGRGTLKVLALIHVRDGLDQGEGTGQAASTGTVVHKRAGRGGTWPPTLAFSVQIAGDSGGAFSKHVKGILHDRAYQKIV